MPPSTTPGARDITAVHVGALSELLLREGNREISLPFGICAGREYGKVRLKLRQTGEESAETIIAAKNDVPADTVGEICDLMYHLMVMMAEKEIPLEDVLAELEVRSRKIGNLKQMHVSDHNT